MGNKKNKLKRSNANASQSDGGRSKRQRLNSDKENTAPNQPIPPADQSTTAGAAGGSSSTLSMDAGRGPSPSFGTKPQQTVTPKPFVFTPPFKSPAPPAPSHQGTTPGAPVLAEPKPVNTASAPREGTTPGAPVLAEPKPVNTASAPREGLINAKATRTSLRLQERSISIPGGSGTSAPSNADHYVAPASPLFEEDDDDEDWEYDGENADAEDEENSAGGNGEASDEDEESSDEDEESSDEDEGPSRMRNTNPSKQTRQKRRLRQPISAARQQRKSARNKGEAYTTDKGKLVLAKTSKELAENCKRKCASRVPRETLPLLCSGLWQGLGDQDKRAAFVASLIDKNPKASQRLDVLPSSSSRKREYTFKYHLPVNGERIEVCKACFMKTFDISAKFISISVKKKMSNVAGIVSNDNRGQASHSTVSEGQRAEVRSFLDSFPKYKSHYAREKTDKNFLCSTLTLKILFDEYKIKCSTTPVSRWIFETEFREMNLKIKPYKIDTCNKCDRLAAEIMYAKNEEERAVKLQEQLVHHTIWEAAQKMKAEDVKEAKRNENVEVVVFDLQQCLPTPYLQTSVVFYKRQLWVYNLTLHICSNNKSVHNMWHEGEGERGANQVGSSLYHYLIGLPEEVQHVILWSDTCGGQNKNSIITATLQTVLQHKKSLVTIDQKFLVPGHTHLECDKDHSIIEAKKKKASQIYVPRDWFNLVATSNKRFSVNRLTADQQLDFKALMQGRDSPLIKREKDQSGEKFSWSKTKWMRHSRSFAPGQVAFKQSLDEAAEFQFYDIKRRKVGPLTLHPGLAHNEPVPISGKKKNDLLSLLYLIDPECHNFYHSLTSTDKDDIHPDIREGSDEEESEGEE